MKRIATGGHGSVYKLDKEVMKTFKHYHHLVIEAVIMMRLNRECDVTSYGPGKGVLRMPFIDGRVGFAAWAEPPSSQDEFNIRKQQLASVAHELARIHSKGIVHADITTANVIVDRDVAHIIDFSSSFVQSRSSSVFCCLTAAQFRAPELDYGNSPDHKEGIDWRIDIWSFGVLALYALTPLRGGVVEKFKNGDAQLNEEMTSLVNDCLYKRIPASEICTRLGRACNIAPPTYFDIPTKKNTESDEEWELHQSVINALFNVNRRATSPNAISNVSFADIHDYIFSYENSPLNAVVE